LKGCTRLSGREQKALSYLTRYLSDEAGQSATEYILIIGLVVVPMAIAFNELQEAIKGLSNKLARLLFGPGV
jgi:Flp pilus assembly pilin Flp